LELRRALIGSPRARDLSCDWVDEAVGLAAARNLLARRVPQCTSAAFVELRSMEIEDHLARVERLCKAQDQVSGRRWIPFELLSSVTISGIHEARAKLSEAKGTRALFHALDQVEKRGDLGTEITVKWLVEGSSRAEREVRQIVTNAQRAEGRSRVSEACFARLCGALLGAQHPGMAQQLASKAGQSSSVEIGRGTEEELGANEIEMAMRKHWAASISKVYSVIDTLICGKRPDIGATLEAERVIIQAQLHDLAIMPRDAAGRAELVRAVAARYCDLLARLSSRMGIESLSDLSARLARAGYPSAPA